jgi:release factor glutamine methyltransferase
VSLAAHLKDLQILATDISAKALQVAQRNANSHGVGERISFAQADLLPGGAEAFDLVCANLPYIPTEKLRTLEVYGHEPNLALDGGPDGLSLIRRLLAQASQRISPGGLFLLEIEETTGSLALEAARRVFPYAQIQILPDLAGRDRLLEIQR